jgi:hypothetical protein
MNKSEKYFFEQGYEFWLGMAEFPLPDASINIDAQNDNGLL